MPPLEREAIRQAIKQRSSVLVFDDAAISGRTLHDLRVALNAWGAREIRTLIIANRMRTPAEAPNIDYYWRFDVPTMGREGHCPLCNALRLAENFSRSLVARSAAYNDLRDWMRHWAKVSPLSRWDKGLNPMPLAQILRKKYCYRIEATKHLTEIPICRSTGLVAHSAEIHAMTGRDDYGLSKIREQTCPEIRVELAATHILLFGDEFDQDVVIDLAGALIDAAAQLPSYSAYGSLAVLTVMQSLTLLRREAQAQVAKKAHTMFGTLIPPRHAQVLVAYLIGCGLADRQDEALRSAARLLSTRHCGVAEKLRALFRETRSPRGNLHAEPIPHLLDRLQKDLACDADEFMRAVDSVSALRDLVQELGTDLARCGHAENSPTSTYAERREGLLKCCDEAEKVLIGLVNPNADVSAARQSAIQRLKAVTSALEAIADCHFLRIDCKNEYRYHVFKSALVDLVASLGDWQSACAGKDVVQGERVVKFSATSGLSPSFGDAVSVWIPWNRAICAIVRDLVANTVWASKQTTDPWDPASLETADLWARIEYLDKSANICLANVSAQSASDVFNGVRDGARRKTRWDALGELGGSVEPLSTSGSQTFAVRILLPYAAFLGR